MSAGIKPELDAAETELILMAQRLKAFLEKRQTQTTIPTTTATNLRTIEQNADKIDAATIINFGWKEIEDGLFLPYIERGQEKYVANQIVAEQVYKCIRTVFSDEMLCCMAFLMERMTKQEADTFNNINVYHCDGSIVGGHRFKSGDFMQKLDCVEKLIRFFQASKSLVIDEVKQNDLFGFIRIDGENLSPFIWEDSEKYLPLFYFVNPSDELHVKSKTLTDPWKVGYIKFCCKVQKVGKEFYEKSSFQVVKFEEILKHFPAGIKYEVSLPESVNQDLLAPEIRVAALHEQNELEVTRPLNNLQSSHCEKENNNNNNNNNNAESVNDLEKNISTNISLDKTEASEQEEKTLEGEFKKYKQHMRSSGKIVPKRVHKRPAQPTENFESKRSKKEVPELQKIPQPKAQLPEERNLFDVVNKTTLSQPCEKQSTTQVVRSQPISKNHITKTHQSSFRDTSGIFQSRTKEPEQTNPYKSTNETILPQPSTNVPRSSTCDTSNILLSKAKEPVQHNRSEPTNKIILPQPFEKQLTTDIERSPAVNNVTHTSSYVPSSTRQYAKEPAQRNPCKSPTTFPQPLNRQSRTDFARSPVVSNNQISNVPHSSPRSASSPGMSPANPFLVEAATVFPSPSTGAKPVPQIANPNGASYQNTQQHNNSYTPQIANPNGASYQNTQQHNNSYTPQIGSGHPSHCMPRVNGSTGLPTSTRDSVDYEQSIPPMYIMTPKPLNYMSSGMSQYAQQKKYLQYHISTPFLLDGRKMSKSRQTDDLKITLPVEGPRFEAVKHAVDQFLMMKLASSLEKKSQWDDLRKDLKKQEFWQNIYNYHYNMLLQQMQHSQFQGPTNQGLVGYQPPSSSMQTYSYPHYIQPNPPINPISVSTTSTMAVQHHGSLPVHNTTIRQNQEINNNIEPFYSEYRVFETVDHPQSVEANPDFYVMRECVLNRKILQAISKSPVLEVYLLNLSEFIEKVLGLNPFTNHLPFKFKHLYKLNPIQKLKWDKVVQSKQLEFVGPFKDVFVEWNEILEFRNRY